MVPRDMMITFKITEQSELSNCCDIIKQPKNELKLWNRVLTEKLTVTQIVKKFPALYGPCKFIEIHY